MSPPAKKKDKNDPPSDHAPPTAPAPAPAPATVLPSAVEAPSFYAGTATVREVLDWYALNDPKPSTNKSAIHERARKYRLFAEAYGDRPCTECRPHHLLAFINLQHGSKSSWTRKGWNSTIQRPFNFAVKLGLIARNPFKGLTFPEGENGRDWTEAEYQTLLRHANPSLRRFIIFIRFSGMRPGEIRGLTWPQIRLDARVIVLEEHKTAYKTKTPRRIPINNVMAKLLVWLRTEVSPRSKHVFLNFFGRPWTTKAITDGIQTIRQKAGLPNDVRPHGGRHTFATDAVLNNVDVATLAQLLGHSKIATTQRYMHLAGKSDHLSDAMERAVANHKPKRDAK